MSDPHHDWDEMPLGDIADVINGRAYKLSEWEESGTPVIRLQNLTQRGGNFYYSNLRLPENQYCHKGDLLYMWSATFGPHIWWGDKAIYHYHIWKIEPKEQIDKTFLFYLLDAKTQEWKAAGSGMAMVHLTKAGIEKEMLPVPPLPEQKKIAEIISGIDSCIARYQEKARILAIAHEVMASKIYTDMHEDPTSYIRRIDEISTLKGGNGFPVEHQGRTAGGTPFIKVSDFNTPGNEYSILNANNYLSAESMAALRPNVFPKNTIVFAKVGAALTSNRRRILSMPTCIDNNLMGAIPGNIRPLYLKFLLERIDFNEFVQDGAVPSVNQSQVGQIEVPVPSMDKQAEVIEALESLKKSKQLLDLTINKRISLKQAIATDLLSGRKRVSV